MQRCEVASLEKKHGDSFSVLSSEYETKVNKLTSDLTLTSTQLVKSQSICSELDASLTQAKLDCVKQNEAFQREKDTLLTEHQQQLMKEKELMQDQMDKELARKRDEITALTDQFKENKSNLETEKKFLMKEVVQWRERYNSRESRPEDLERVRELETEMVDKDHLVKKTKDEMMYFKREMLNREECYNQKFGVTPNVGVMNVLKTKDQKNTQKGGGGPGKRG